MSLTERQRHDAYEALRETFGDRTDDVIQMLQPDHEQLVTKDDLAITTGVLRTEMADLRTDLKTEMADLRTDLKTEMADLRTEFKTEMAVLSATFERRITDAFQAQTRSLLIGLVVSFVLLAASTSLSITLG